MKLYQRTIVVAVIAVVLIALPALAEEAPNTALYDMAGKRHVLYAVLDALPDDGLAMINFTSIHCKPCKKEIPELLRIVGTSGRTRLL